MTNLQKTKPENYRTCSCGKVCKGRAALANHGRACPQECERSDLFIQSCETGDWSAYRARYGAA